MMKRRKRIALFVGQADEDYQSRFITGFLKNAFADNYDVCVFAMYRKYQDTAEREQGESVIFSLVNPAMFDGAIILKDSIQTAGAAHELETHLKQVFESPVVVIEKESDLFPSICTDCYHAVYDLVSHLIEIHDCRDIAFLGGKKWHKHTQERLQAYRDAMREHGLRVRDDRIIYGDFWYQSGEMCAEHLLEQECGLPDAVACANDQMAIGLCKAFEEHGVHVPDDIRVVGYDSIFEGQTSPKSITSAQIPSEEFGEYAFHFLIACMEGRVPESFKIMPPLIFGESCGCTEKGMPHYQRKRQEWSTDISEEGFSSIFNYMEENLIVQSSLQEYLSAVYSYVYQIRGVREFHLCLSKSWKYAAQSISMQCDGFPDEMIHAIRYYSDHRDNMVGIEQLFDTAEILPDLFDERDQPTAFFFTPISFENTCFGYAAVQYGDVPRSYDETYRHWIGTVCRGFEILRRNLVMKRMQEQLDKIRNNKFAVSNLAFESLSTEEKAEYQLVSRILDENLLNYHFQPIIRASDGEIYAYEALMRSRTERPVSPLSIIKYAAMQDRLSDVECATFLNVLKIVDEQTVRFGDAKVFINSIPGVRIGDGDFVAATEYLQKHHQQVVVELTEEAELKDADLARLKEFFNTLQIDIAVDDYGTGYSNVSNLLRYLPNYVKIDRSLISEIQNQPKKMHFVREIIDFCHDNQILALAEGVETAEELRTVIHLGVDLLQGYYTARPAAEIITQINEQCRMEIRQYYQERIDGAEKKIYIAGKTNRISLAKLVKDGCTDIVAGRGQMVYQDISVIGTPQMKTDIHLRVETGYSGRITLEDVYFSNVKNRPCIELGDHSDVTLILLGNNTLSGSGIQVPETAKLVIEGEGSLNLDLNAAESFGIGNGHSLRHGTLVFEQDGIININSRGKAGIGIGSGLGGITRIECGEFNLHSNTETFVGIGTLTGDAVLELKTCHIEAEFTVTTGVAIGSMEGDVSVTVRSSAISVIGDGKHLTGIGTLCGGKAELSFQDAGITLNLGAEHSTCMGALNGVSEINAGYTSLKLTNAGQEALALGGSGTQSTVTVHNSDTRINVRNAIARETYAPEKNLSFINGRLRILVNGAEIERPLKYDY